MGHYDEEQRKTATEWNMNMSQKERVDRTIQKAPFKGNIPIEKIQAAVNSSCRKQIVDMLEEAVKDTMQVFDFGASKHPDSGATPNFLTPAGNKCSLHERGSSVLRHAARTFMHPELKDEESEVLELLHLIASASILYIRHKRAIVHPTDNHSDEQTEPTWDSAGS